MLIWVAHEKKAHTFANLYQLYVANILISDVNTELQSIKKSENIKEENNRDIIMKFYFKKEN